MRMNLRWILPGALMMAISIMLWASYLDAVVNDRAAVRARERDKAVLSAEHLARSAQGGLANSRTAVASELSMVSADPEVRTLALISPDGRVELAHRLAWQGQLAVAVIPDFDAVRFLKATQSRLPDVLESDDGNRISVMSPYFLDADIQQIRSAQRGVLYLEYDLHQAHAIARWDAQRRLWPQIGLALVIMLGLLLVLRTRVVAPLKRLESAVLQFSESDEATEPVPESGPQELFQLARGFNVMSRRVHEAHKAMQVSTHRLSGIIDAAMDAIITVDTSQRILVINPAALAMFGCTETQAMGQSIEMFIPARYRDSHQGHVQSYVDTGLSNRAMGRRTLIRGLRSNGEEFPAEASISHLEVEGERLLTVILHDVTERQKAEEKILALNASLELQVEQRTANLRALNEEQHIIFDTVTVGIALMKDRAIIRCNRKLDELFGYGQGELQGLSTRVWYADEQTYVAAGAPVIAQIEKHGMHQREQELVRKDGSRFWARITGQKFHVSTLEDALLCIVEDLTLERKATQAILEAKELAEQASRAKSSFLANMSHEIRTPMNAIIGMSYLLAKTDMAVRQRDYIKKIQGSSQHLLSLINDILDYSKIEAGKLSIESIEFDLDKVLDNVANLIGEKATAKGLELVFDVDTSVPRQLIGDPLRLGQILINYATNAIKFTEKGEVDIRIRLLEESDSGVHLHCAVKDTGIGLTDDQKTHLFQSFQQADDSTTRKFGGTGLGLAISRELAAMMHGEVGVESEYGFGSTFWFTARLQKSALPARPMILQSELFGKRVLVVDDNESARLSLTDTLRALHLAPVPVESGAQALEEIYRADIAGQAFEVVFLDWQMPGMDGIELSNRLRALPLASPPHVVLVTGYGREEVLKSAEDAGIHTVLVKPVNASMLFDCVARELGDAVPGGLPYEGPEPDHEIALGTLRGARVLLVEDNVLNQEVACELLREAGLVVDLAENGKIAVEMVQSAAYELVLMDMQMPVMDGLTATRLIRELPGFGALPIVAMTANAMLADRAACLLAGMNDHVGKPIEPSLLFLTLIKWIKPRPGSVGNRHRPAVADQAVDIPVIKGLDTVGGVRRVLGKKSLYLGMLHKFLEGQGQVVEKIQVAVAAGEWDTAERHAHTLKGLAGNIGMPAIQALAASVETACKAQLSEEAVAIPLQHLHGALALFLQELQSKLPVLPSAHQALETDPEKTLVLLKQLRDLLATDDMLACDLLADHSVVLHATLGEPYVQIDTAIRGFDFELAMQILTQTLSDTGIDLPA